MRVNLLLLLGVLWLGTPDLAYGEKGSKSKFFDEVKARELRKLREHER